MHKIRTLTLAAIASIFVVMAAMACGDGNGDSLSIEEYFQQLGELDATFDDRIDALDVEYTERFEELGFEDSEGEAALVVEFFNEARGPITDLVNGIDSLNPPAEAEEAHERSVTSGRRVISTFEEMIDRARDADPEELFVVLEDDAEFNEAADAFNAACFELQAIADEHGIDIDLGCGDF